MLCAPRRLAILRLVAEGERDVGTLVELLACPQSNVSYHAARSACTAWSTRAAGI